MARHKDALEIVAGKLFDRKRRNGGGRMQAMPPSMQRPRVGRTRSSKAQRMARALQFRSPAVFKLIRNAGTTSGKGLKGQLDYVFDKTFQVSDSSMRYDGQTTLSNADRNRIVRDWERDFWGTAKQGYTSHMLMSFPKGTHPETALSIACDVANEMFQSGDVRYEYVLGVHTDTDFPHAHLIVNRRGDDNKLLTFRQGTEFSYEAMREAMVAHAERHGVLLEESSRFERGHVHRAPTVREVYQAREEGRAPQETPREGKDLEFALRQTSESAEFYSGLAFLASKQQYSQLAEVVMKASTLLKKNQPISKETLEMPNDAMTEAEAFDKKIEELSDAMTQARDNIQAAAPADRPQLEKDYNDVLRDLADISPGNPDAELLQREPGAFSPYFKDGVVNPDALTNEDFRNDLSITLEGTGIDPDEAIARMQAGAEHIYLEREWALADIKNYAEAKGMDISTNEALDAVREEVFDLYAYMRGDMINYGVAIEAETQATEHTQIDTVAAAQESRLPDRLQPLMIDYQNGQYFSTLSSENAAAIEDLKATLSSDELDAIRAGDSTALEEITGDPKSAAYLQMHILKQDIQQGHSYDPSVFQKAVQQSGIVRVVGDEEDGHGEV